MPDGLESSSTNIASDHGVGNARRSIAITCGRSAYVRRLTSSGSWGTGSALRLGLLWRGGGGGGAGRGGAGRPPPPQPADVERAHDVEPGTVGCDADAGRLEDLPE